MKHAEAIRDNINAIMCGEVESCFDEGEPMDVAEYIGDALDFEIRTGLDGDYRSARIMVGFGGPNIFIDTKTEIVQVFWWNEYAEQSIDSDFCAQVDEYLRELYECRF